MKKTLKNKRIFISGGNGVIGNELVRKLYKEGAIIFVGDLKPRPLHWPSDILYRQGDLNYIAPEELKRFKPNIFFHLAATFERTKETYEFWDENFHNNIRLSNYLMSILKDISSLQKVIFASSYLVYNENLYQFNTPQTTPIKLKEDFPIMPRNLTGMAKLAHECELLFLNNFKNKQFKFISARIFRGYGKNSRDVISRWIRAIIKNEEILLYNKENIFDYIYAEDSAEGLLRLAKSDFCGIVNLGTGIPRKVEDIIKILFSYFPKMKIREIHENIPYEASCADVTLLNSILNWTPKITLEEGIKKIIEFEKQRNGVYEESIGEKSSILITSVSKKIPLINIIRASSKKFSNNLKIIGGDCDKNCIGKYFTDEFWKMKLTEKYSLRDIITECKKRNIKYIIPTRDNELMFWAKIKNELKKHNIHVMVSPPQTIKITNDKLLFYNTLKNKYPVIETSTKIEDIKSTYYVVKERFGAGSRKIGINLTYNKAIDFAKELENPIFQPFIEGKEISIDVYVTKEGKCKEVVLRERNLIVNGESHISTIFNNRKLKLLFSELSEFLNIRGHAIFQAIIKGNNAYIIECNCRLGGASTLSICSGLETIYWFLLEANNENINTYYSKIEPQKLIRVYNDYFFKI
ncbi:MAG: ATP-grasp domain-containing protein [Bacteroidales bacterium]|nr:ATP-grasp domain-containing protein [Bacteroidales bacterium]